MGMVMKLAEIAPAEASATIPRALAAASRASTAPNANTKPRFTKPGKHYCMQCKRIITLLHERRQ